MLNFKFLPTHFTLFLVFGIVLGYYFKFSNIFLIVSVLIFILGLIYFNYKSKSSFKPPVLFTIFTAFSFLCIGIISIQLQNSNNQKDHYLANYSFNNQIVIKIKSVLKPSKAFQKYEADVIQVNSIKTKGSILLNVYKQHTEDTLNVDDLLLTYLPLREINHAMNPNEFDYREFLKKKGLHRQLNLKNEEFILLGKGKKTLKGYAFQFRLKINRALKPFSFSPNELSIINAILLGQRNDISKDLFESYKNAGAIHILAVSGLHIGIILLLLNLLFQPLEKLKNGKTIKLIIVILSLWIYAFIAGMSASVVRATTMFTAIAIGWMSNRSSNIKNSLIVSFFLLLLIHPLFLFDVGFQLSYTAVFSIVLIQPIFIKQWRPKLKIVRYFWQLLTVSFAAQLGILPLSLFYFHQFPGLFFVSSLVIIPILGIIIGFGIVLIILALLQILPSFFANSYGYIISLMNTFIDFIAEQDSFVIQDIYFSIFLAITFYVILISIINFVLKPSAQNLIIILVSIVFVQVSFIYEKLHIQKTDQFIVFHQIKNSIIAVRKQNEICFYHHLDSLDIQKNRTVNSYLSGLFSHQNIKYNPLKNIYKYNNKWIYIVDSSAVYKSLPFSPETVVITKSPKINLNRLIKILHPKLIIADGSNYKSYTTKWEKTCKNENVGFYNTSQNGAFVATFSP